METNQNNTPITTRVVGVSFEGRQAVVARLKIGEMVYLVRNPDNPFDPNAIKVYRWNGHSFGFLSRELAADLAERFDRYRRPVRAKVTGLPGGFEPWASLGVIIQFDPPA